MFDKIDFIPFSQVSLVVRLLIIFVGYLVRVSKYFFEFGSINVQTLSCQHLALVAILTIYNN